MTLRRNPQFMPAIKQEAKRRMVDAGKVVTATVVDLIDDEGGGTPYRASQNPPSLPGEPPAMQTGELVHSIDYSDVDEFDSSLEIHVGSDVPHALYLEAGTATMEPRPFLLPGLLQSKDRVMKAIGGRNG